MFNSEVLSAIIYHILASLVVSWERICLQHRRPRFDPWVGKISWRREWQPTPVFLLREFHVQRSQDGYSTWDHKESDSGTVQLTFFTTF